jgi:hypothetical protein
MFNSMKLSNSSNLLGSTGIYENKIFIIKDDKILKSMIKASELAHKMAFNLVYCNQLESNNDVEEEEEEIEFEINKDFVEFYKESLKYKLEKSLCFLFFTLSSEILQLFAIDFYSGAFKFFKFLTGAYKIVHHLFIFIQKKVKKKKG